uniref:Putative secreted protein n=1 Tax=Amblyomma americanum TaxID=6943 RepID=A0A0C9S5E6_AMBAM
MKKSQVVLLCLLINIKLSSQRGTGRCPIDCGKNAQDFPCSDPKQEQKCPGKESPKCKGTDKCVCYDGYFRKTDTECVLLKRDCLDREFDSEGLLKATEEIYVVKISNTLEMNFPTRCLRSTFIPSTGNEIHRKIQYKEKIGTTSNFHFYIDSNNKLSATPQDPKDLWLTRSFDVELKKEKDTLKVLNFEKTQCTMWVRTNSTGRISLECDFFFEQYCATPSSSAEKYDTRCD